MKRLSSLTLIPLTLCLVFATAAFGQAPQPPEVAAKSFLVLDLTSNQTLAEREADASADPASLTKLMSAYVAAMAATRLPDAARPQRLVLVGPSTQKQRMPEVPANTLVIHGEVDDVVPLAATLGWARAQSLPVIVFPGVGHFFHGQLGLLRSVVVQELSPRQPL